MWANAQRDGRPAEYRWRPLFNAAVWLTPTTRVPCSNADKTRNPLKFADVPQTRQQISATIVAEVHHIVRTCEGRHCCLTSFFPIVETCLICEDIAEQSCAMVPRWRIFGDFLGPAFPASRVQHISDLHSKFPLWATSCVKVC